LGRVVVSYAAVLGALSAASSQHRGIGTPSPASPLPASSTPRYKVDPGDTDAIDGRLRKVVHVVIRHIVAVLGVENDPIVLEMEHREQ
jgi:hypothetical protein